MEIRCSSCNKLYRISDDKIVGKGIKFSCSRCKEVIKVTQEDLERYNLSKTAVTVLDLFVEKPKTPAPAEKQQTPSVAPQTLPPQPAAPEPAQKAPVPEVQKKPEVPQAPVPDFLQEQEAPPAFESSPFIESPQEQTKPAAQKESVPDVFQEVGAGTESAQKAAEPQTDVFSAAAEIRPGASPAAETAGERKPAQTPVPAEAPKPQPQAIPVQEQKAAPAPGGAAAVQSQAESGAPKTEAKPSPVTPAAAATPPKTKPEPVPVPPPSPAPRPAPGKTPAKPAVSSAQRMVISATPAAPQRSGNMLIIIIVVILLLLGIGGYAVYKLFLQPSGTSGARSQTSIDGLQLENPSWSQQPNGDLLITGSVRNTTNRPRDAWLVVIQISDAGGKYIQSLRLVNGKQLYTQADFAVLSARGENVQELKRKMLQDPGVAIPPNGSVDFEIRYLQPSPEANGINAMLQPFDPVKIIKEMAAEAR